MDFGVLIFTTRKENCENSSHRLARRVILEDWSSRLERKTEKGNQLTGQGHEEKATLEACPHKWNGRL